MIPKEISTKCCIELQKEIINKLDHRKEILKIMKIKTVNIKTSLIIAEHTAERITKKINEAVEQ